MAFAARGAITIRLRDDDDHQVIERAKAATYERTAAKALMRAARLYPDTRDDLQRTRERLAEARKELAEIRKAFAQWEDARHAETRARAALMGLSRR